MTSAASPYVVIDTNFFVYAIVGAPIAATFEPYFTGKIGLISFQTVASLRFMALRRKWGSAKVADLESRLRAVVVVPPTDAITARWAQLMYDQVQAGSRLELEDAWIAATAFVYDCPVVTNDRKDFERIAGLNLLPP